VSSAIELGPGDTRANPRCPPLGVDVDPLHAANVDHEAVVDQRQPGHRVPAGAHGELEPLLAGEGERRDHVVRRGTASHQRRATFDHAVEQGARVRVLGGAGLVYGAAQADA
jgi:hypothetical protein